MRPFAAGAAAVVVVAWASLLVLPPAGAELRQVPLSDVVASLPLGTADGADPVLYVVAVDTSGSMQESGAYPAVATAITDLVGGLDPQDQISVITFDVAPRQCGPGVFAAADAEAVTACLPPAATGEYTDVGRAFEQVLAVLEGTPAALATVVLVSDGVHQPGPGSPYPADGSAEDPAWRALADRADTLPAVAAYALPLATADGTEGDGAAVLGAVFGSPTVLRADSPADVRAALDVPVAAARTARTRALLEPDVAAGIEVEAAPAPTVGTEPVEWPLTLRSPAAHVPWTVGDLGLDLGPAVAVDGLPAAVELAPGQAVVLRPTLRATGAAGSAADAPTLVRGSLTTVWADALDELGLTTPTEVSATLDAVPVAEVPAAAAGVVELPAQARVGVAAAAVAVVAAGAAMAWWVLRGRAGRAAR